MIRLPILALCLPLAACTSPAVITVGEVTVRTSGRGGGQGTLYVKHGGTEIISSDNNEDSFRELNKTARFAGGVMAATRVARGITDAYTSVKNASTAAGVTKTAAETEAAAAAAKASELVLPAVPQP